MSHAYSWQETRVRSREPTYDTVVNVALNHTDVNGIRSPFLTELRQTLTHEEKYCNERATMIYLRREWQKGDANPSSLLLLHLDTLVLST
jgi:hypothetical protein